MNNYIIRDMSSASLYIKFNSFSINREHTFLLL